MTIPRKPSKKYIFWNTIFIQTIYFIRKTPLSWFFGLLLALPLLALVFFESLSFQPEQINLFLMTPKISGALLLSILFFFIAESGLILSFKKTLYSPLEHAAATGALIRWYFLFTLILLAFFALFFSPSTVVPPETRQPILSIGFVFFLLIAGVSFILKMFGGFYLILSKLSLRNALRSSADLFIDHIALSFLFLIITSALSVVISFIAGSFHAFIHFPLSETIILNTLLLFCLLLLSSFFHIFFRAFWYFFFQAIATEKPKGWQEEKKMVKENMVPVEDEA